MAFDKAVSAVHSFTANGQRFSIFYHMDVDGIVSAALLTKALNALGKTVKGYRPSNYEDFDNGFDISEFDSPIIICDMQLPPSGFHMLAGKTLCIIDHHEVIEPRDSVYINPKTEGYNVYTPCSLLVYELFRKELDSFDWLAVIGLISDAGGKENPELVVKICEKYGLAPGKHEYLTDNTFGDAGSMINNFIISEGRDGASASLELLLNCNAINDVIENPMLKSVNYKVESEIKALLERLEVESEKYSGKIYFFKMPADKKRYSSTLATIASLNQYKGKVIVVLTEINKNLERVNIRANSLQVDVPKALDEIFRGIKGSGGGHKVAAGASINPRDETKFKQELLKQMKGQLDIMD